MSNNSVNKHDAAQNESFSELLVQLARSSSVVVRDEIELVIQRVREMLKDVRSGILLIATGAVIGFAAFLCLCGALIIGLSSYMPPVIAAIVTGVALAAVGVAIAMSGYRQLKK